MIRAIAPSPLGRTRPAPKNRRRPAFAKTDLKRAIDAVQKAGIQVRSIEFSKDGGFRFYSDDNAGGPHSLFDEWEARL